MTKDRTEQFKNEMAKDTKSSRFKFWSKESRVDEEFEEEQVALTGVTVHPVITKDAKKEQETLNAIFKEVECIKEWVAKIKEDTAVLKSCQVMVQQSTRQEASMKEKIHDIMANIRVTSGKVRTALQVLEKKKEETDNAINRVVTTQHSMMSKAYFDAMDDYQQNLLLHKKICEDILLKQLHIVIQMVIRRVTSVPADRDVSDEQLMAMLDQEDPAVFSDNYMKETLEARLILQDAQDRYKEIINIEKTITELNEMFHDLAAHVSRQGEMIERIDHHIYGGSELTQKANKRLSRAEKFIKKARKKKIWLILILLVVVIILLLMIIFNLF